MKEFLASLGITQKGNISDNGNYVIEFKNDSEWSKANSILANSDELEEMSDGSSVRDEGINITYTNDKFVIIMKTDFDMDEYTLVCKEN